MGTWGTGIYSNDTSLDVRDLCQEIFPFVSLDEGNRIIFEEFKDLLLNPDENDNDYASFWYGLSDWEWKHGMLGDEIKEKALSLLNMHAGIAQWKTDASKTDIKKRIKTLEKLKAQLLLPQPNLKKPKAIVPKPRHKVGDIVVIQTSEHMCWQTESYYISGIYIQNGRICYVHDYAIQNKINFEIDLRNKFFALLCVGKTHELYSSYVKDVYKEESIYAVYNYLSDICPTVEDLFSVGFLPSFERIPGLIRTNRYAVERWVYKCTVMDTLTWGASSVKKIGRYETEAERFEELLCKKNVSAEYTALMSTLCLFNFLETPIAYEIIGKNADTLIDPSIPKMVNPTEEQWQIYDEFLEEKYKRI